MTTSQMVTHKSLNGLGLPKHGICPGFSSRSATIAKHGGKELIFKVKSYHASFDDGMNDIPAETLCPVIIDSLCRTHADIEAVITQIRILFKARKPIIVAAFEPDRSKTRKVEYDSIEP